jgi:hypothetical protein
MNVESGGLQSSFRWVDIQGIGSPLDDSGTILDLLDADIALVFKDYDPSAGNADTARSGIGAPDLYVRATNFGVGDLIYIDNQVPEQANLLNQIVPLANTPNPGVTRLSFGTGVNGLGGRLEIDLADSSSSFTSFESLNSLLQSIYPLVQSD